MWIGVMMMMLGAALSLSDRRYRIGAPKRTRQLIEGQDIEGTATAPLK
jgi:cytochrome c biogenesis factor